ncbi:transcription factor bHLH68-like [Phaseolus vulgaris]|uniref:transcription factor bHLH68-like n=1 Tax=Phaseolus vulgaris TaxID=3885 RepID=UPI0035CA180B
MNRGVLQSSPVQQMITGNPNWWNININSMPPQAPPFFSTTPSNFPIPYAPTSLPFPSWNENQELPESWSQLLMSGVVDEQGKVGMGQFQSKKLENWEDQMLAQAPNASLVDVKQENSANSYVYGHGNEELQSSKPSWSPKSCVTSFSSSMLDFSNSNTDARHPPPDRSSEVRFHTQRFL